MYTEIKRKLTLTVVKEMYLFISFYYFTHSVLWVIEDPLLYIWSDNDTHSLTGSPMNNPFVLPPIRKWRVGCPLKQWAAQWTGSAHCLCKLIIISAHGLHMGSSVGRSCPLTFNLIIISDHGLAAHGQLRLLDYIVGSSVGSSNLNAEVVVGSGQLQHRLIIIMPVNNNHTVVANASWEEIW